MRNMIKIAVAAGMTLAMTACDRGAAPANNAAANELDANMTMSEPANDASAMESTTNAAEPVAPMPAENSSNSGTNVGGDAGGNNVESNTVGM
ncbi:MAG: hypothetical protein E6G92_07475 [Alphaproteobacteria bacterium]|nr:MAG: hypothetical protein E6G92_07475 [Alphaproteobacteria bacterium]